MQGPAAARVMVVVAAALQLATAAAVWAAAAAPPPPSPSFSPAMPLTVLDATEAKRRGAVCLDGSPPAIYHRPAASPALNTSWVIFLKGGAWCSSPADCAGRSRSNLGTSTLAPKVYGNSGPLDPDPALNPTFAQFHHVCVWYWCVLHCHPRSHMACVARAQRGTHREKSAPQICTLPAHLPLRPT